ncbi:short integuments 2, mitochondrial-like [Selaginella moellendorffii]|uniref:short integuments 2, mitochondrial-like n=1 Tax=Selaginella moellendorffii TaxID=88036 RepID=UPI000D1C5FC8|nr:short integuments 2, mitochondrial-like [Selaginella moellendorffii]|eukprot:XP_024522318.1 short integuments 2, mitochondrial-like [Selaginella moellendorffii]
MALSAPVIKTIAQKIAPKSWLVPDRRRTFDALKEEARRVHLLLEVRDARVPFTSANLQFQRFLKWKHHITVFTKIDLADKEKLAEWKNYFKGENYFFLNSYSRHCVSALMSLLKTRLLEASPSDSTKVVMVVGLPSVGKTTLVNGLHRIGRRRVQMLEKLTLSKVSLTPYQTTSFFNCKICYRPPMYAMDTPSVMYPTILDAETGLKLCLTGAMQDSVVGEVKLARFLLAVINSMRSSVHSVWKAEFEAKRFMKDPLDKTKKTDRKLIRLDDNFVQVKGIIATELLSFEGDLRREDEMQRLVDHQFRALHGFYESVRTSRRIITDFRIARRLLSLYRVGKLGRYTWDAVPTMSTELLKHNLS